MRSFTAAQRHQITGSLFWLLGAGAVATVAAPALLPCPAIERTRNDDESSRTRSLNTSSEHAAHVSTDATSSESTLSSKHIYGRVNVQVLPLEENQTAAWSSSLAAHPQTNSSSVTTASTTTTTAATTSFTAST
ncbi:hypothetical protein BDF22DRAFT_773491 [Syncephalis plumigaleata]|nr:hypothetical protein BDF22DRAFT_773491 [Syncephalis plumigaleata]